MRALAGSRGKGARFLILRPWPEAQPSRKSGCPDKKWNSYSMVLSAGSPGFDVLLYANEKHDVSELVLEKLGHPEKKLNNVINFLGSSGKFTTLYSIKCFIEANNQTTTAYISPSLRDIKERFWMGDRYLTHPVSYTHLRAHET